MEVAILVVTLLTLFAVFGLYSLKHTEDLFVGSVFDEPNEYDFFSGKNPRRVAAGQATAKKMKRGNRGRFSGKA